MRRHRVSGRIVSAFRTRGEDPGSGGYVLDGLFHHPDEFGGDSGALRSGGLCQRAAGRVAVRGACVRRSEDARHRTCLRTGDPSCRPGRTQSARRGSAMIETRLQFEAVIGLEVHVELATQSKMFCGCRNAFGAKPNTLTCPVCLGMPGTLPVINRRAVEYLCKSGFALECTVAPFSKFDRKNYFYPDMPKNYQISQYDMPLTVGGSVRYWLEDGSRGECRLTRIHLEEDTGKSTHASADGRLAGATSSLIAFNRAGVPLMECVGEPDIRSADEALAFLETLARTFRELGVSDVKMEEGSLRCDANVSIRRRGAAEYGTKAEIKNMNSFRSVRRAIESEVARQIAVVESGGRVIQETRGWDETAGTTHSQRSKEEAHDYRYFPDPDLVPMDVTGEVVERVRATLVEAPSEGYVRYVDTHGLDSKRATQLVDDHALAAWFDRAVAAAGGNARDVV